MERTSNRPISRSAVAMVSAVFVTLGPGAAGAATWVGTPEVSGACSLGAEIHRWTPSDGPPARFVAEAFVRRPTDAWVGLGYTSEGFWSAESATPSDACEDCEHLDLVLTRFDGTRRSFPVVTSREHTQLATDQGKLRDLALRRLWHLAATEWRAGDLKQDYAFRLPATVKRDGTMDPFPGWMIEVSRRGGWLLRFSQEATKSMCWCDHAWRGWKLASKAPRSVHATSHTAPL